jgi:hypothetical protein
MNAEDGGYLKRHNHKKVDILREWSMKANVTVLKFTCKTNYCCEIWVYIIVLFLFCFHCRPCHYAAAFSKLCADKPPSKCVANFIWDFMGGSKWFNRFGNVNNIGLNGIHRQRTQGVYCLTIYLCLQLICVLHSISCSCQECKCAQVCLDSV